MAQLADSVCRVTPYWNEIVYLTQNSDEVGRKLPFGVVAGTDELLFAGDRQMDVVIGTGIPAIRRRLAQSLRQHSHLRFPNLIHPRANFDPRAVQIGEGNLITVGSVFTCDIEMGDFNVFNLNVTIGHDARIGSFNVLNPGCNVSGNVRIGDECLLGTGSQVIENTCLASRSILGAGAVLVRSVDEPGLTWVGVPARPI